MQLVASSMVRLYGISENLDESGQYQLMPLDVDAFNEDIDEDEIEDTLTGLTEVLYGHESGCHWHEITDDMFDDGKIGIEIESDNRLEIRDITDMINIDPEHSRFYIVVNATRTEYLWIVAVSQGTVYTG